MPASTGLFGAQRRTLPACASRLDTAFSLPTPAVTHPTNVAVVMADCTLWPDAQALDRQASSEAGSTKAKEPVHLAHPVLITGPLPPAQNATIPAALSRAVPAPPAFPTVKLGGVSEWMHIVAPGPATNTGGGPGPFLHLRNVMLTDLPVQRLPFQADAQAAHMALPLFTFRQLSWWPAANASSSSSTSQPQAAPTASALAGGVAAMAAAPSILLHRVVIQLPAMEVAALMALSRLPGGRARLPSVRAAALTAAAANMSDEVYADLAVACIHPALDGVTALTAAPAAGKACWDGAHPRSLMPDAPAGSALLAAAYHGWGAVGTDVCFVPRAQSAADYEMLARLSALLTQLERAGAASWWASYNMPPPTDTAGPSAGRQPPGRPLPDIPAGAPTGSNSGAKPGVAIGVGVGVGTGCVAAVAGLALLVAYRKRR
jgi:hypothetical protein